MLALLMIELQRQPHGRSGSSTQRCQQQYLQPSCDVTRHMMLAVCNRQYGGDDDVFCYTVSVRIKSAAAARAGAVVSGLTVMLTDVAQTSRT